MTVGILVFTIVGIIAVASAVGMVLSRNTVYAALFLILNFITVGLLYLILGAPFIALAQITVYAGAIMVLFLFVIMLLGTKKLENVEPLRWQRPLAIVLAAALIIEGVYVLLTKFGLHLSSNPAVAELADPKTVGLLLYQKFSLPFEVTSIILLVAAIGAVVADQDRSEGRRYLMTFPLVYPLGARLHPLLPWHCRFPDTEERDRDLYVAGIDVQRCEPRVYQFCQPFPERGRTGLCHLCDDHGSRGSSGWAGVDRKHLPLQTQY